MTDRQDDPTHNLGADPLEAAPAAGRGGKEEDLIPEQIDSAERLKGSEHGRSDAETQEERGASVQTPGHVSNPDEVSQESQDGSL